MNTSEKLSIKTFLGRYFMVEKEISALKEWKSPLLRPVLKKKYLTQLQNFLLENSRYIYRNNNSCRFSHLLGKYWRILKEVQCLFQKCFSQLKKSLCQKKFNVPKIGWYEGMIWIFTEWCFNPVLHHITDKPN